MATINFTNGPDYVDADDINPQVGDNTTFNLLKGEDTFYGTNYRDTVHGGDGAGGQWRGLRLAAGRSHNSQ